MTGHLGIHTRQIESKDTSKNTKAACLSELKTSVDNIGKTHLLGKGDSQYDKGNLRSRKEAN